MSKPEHIDPRKLRHGPIRHESLPAELLERIETVYKVIDRFLGMTLEQFEIGFMRDLHPQSEVALWRGITTAWLAYQENFLPGEELPVEQEKKLLAALIAISSGATDVAKLGVQVVVGRRLLACYVSLLNE
jgi:hypothetical protein